MFLMNKRLASIAFQRKERDCAENCFYEQEEAMDFIYVSSLVVFVEFLQIPDFMFLRRVSKEFILRWNLYSKFMWNRLESNLEAQLKFNGFCQSSIEFFKLILQGGNISFSGGGLKAVLTGKVRTCDADLYVYPEGS